MKWLKGIFARKEEPDPEPVEVSVELAKLDSWVESRLAKGFSKIQSDIEASFGSLRSLVGQLKDDLEELGSAGLLNENIHERERQIMEGNRESYIYQHKLFIDRVVIPDSLDYRNTSQFCEAFEQLLLQLAKSTGRSHLIMGEFFLKQSKRINKTLKEMSDIVSGIKEQMQDYDIDLEANDLLARQISELQSKLRHLGDLSQENSVLATKLSNSKAMKQKLEKQIAQLKESDSYSEFRELDQKKSEHWDSLKLVGQSIEGFFSPIGRPMKKYERVAFDNADVLKAYLDNPVSALADDPQFRILSVLSGLKQAVADDKLGLKDKEVDKYQERIAGITRDVLDKARKEYLASKASIKEIDDRMRSIQALQELNDLNYKMEHVDNQIQMLNDKIEKNRKGQEKIDVDRLRADVEKSLSRTFNLKVVIL